MDLTKRQKEIFDYIKRYASKQGYPPDSSRAAAGGAELHPSGGTRTLRTCVLVKPSEPLTPTTPRRPRKWT